MATKKPAKNNAPEKKSAAKPTKSSAAKTASKKPAAKTKSAPKKTETVKAPQKAGLKKANPEGLFTSAIIRKKSPGRAPVTVTLSGLLIIRLKSKCFFISSCVVNRIKKISSSRSHLGMLDLRQNLIHC